MNHDKYNYLIIALKEPILFLGSIPVFILTKVPELVLLGSVLVPGLYCALNK